MAKYGRGLNREIVGAVNHGLIKEPFSISDVRKFAEQRGWNVPETFMIVCLANGSNTKHSQTYVKYFESLGDGKYRLNRAYKGHDWR